jgi:DNA-binding beta-propeller fold protein YncE
VLFLAPDGGAPKGGFVGPPLRKGLGFMGGSAEGFVRYFDHVAVSGDGKWLYVSGGRFASPKHMRHAVARVAPGQTDLPKAWLGQYDKPGDGETHLNDPQGVAVDAAGCVYVADRGNGRVVVHSPEGKRLGQVAVADPLQVFVHPRGGWIYVSAGAADSRGRMKAFTLRKFSPFRPGGPAPKELARLSGTGKPLVALDPTARPPKLWLARTTRAGQELLPVIDRGETLELGKALGAGRERGLSYPMFLAADEPHGKLYVTEFRNRQVQFDLKTARMTTFARGGETAVDADGFVYVIEGYPPRVFLHRYDPRGKPANYPGTDSAKIGPIDTASKGPHVGFRGHTIAPNGDLYILQMKFYGRGRVVVYDRTGRRKAEALVEGIPNGGAGVAVDRAGCVYVSANIKPADKPYPDDFADLLPKKGWVWWRRPRPAPWDRPYYNAYLYHWGSVFKFPATGGRFYPAYKELGKGGRPPAAIPDGAARYRTGYLNADVGVGGALWRHHGLAPIPSSSLNWGDPSCTCLGARFSLDAFGRLFVPDVFRFAVNVLDANGNLITRLGRYGNADDDGLSLAWAAYASVSGGKLFLSDMANRRVSIVRLAPATVATAAIPAGR